VKFRSEYGKILDLPQKSVTKKMKKKQSSRGFDEWKMSVQKSKEGLY